MSPKLRSRRPSAALIIAVLALVVSLGGNAAYAASKISGSQIIKGTLSGKALRDASVKGTKLAAKTITAGNIADKAITAGQIADKTITAGQVADNTLTGQQINESTLGQVPSAVSAGPIGPAGGDLAGAYPNPTIRPGSVGANALGTIVSHDSAAVNVAANATASASVNCAAGEQVISGGNDTNSANNGRVVASRQNGNGWIVFLHNESGAAITVTAHVYCLAP